MNIRLTLNNRPVSIDVPASSTLLGALRSARGLVGVKHGCETGECGACTVLFDGKPVNSCVMLAAQADGHHLTPIEAVGEHPEQGWRATEGLDPIQQAFVETGAIQCGYCTPAMILGARALLGREPNPTPGVSRGRPCGGGGAGDPLGGGPDPAPEVFRAPPLEPVEGGGGGPEVLTRAGVLPRMQVAPRLRPGTAGGKPARQG